MAFQVEGIEVRDELAGQLLDKLFDWTNQERAEWMADLSVMANYKFDHYEGFSVGERFFERLARWLVQFENADDRRRLVDFVRGELVFISRDEMNQAILGAYPHHIKPILIRQAAEALSLPQHRLAAITGSPEFGEIRRKTLFLGLSDEARLDQLRRSSSELSHEQFSLSAELGDYAKQSMVEKLAAALVSQGATGSAAVFQHIVLVDDFYGSGTSLIDQREDNQWKGKLVRAKNHLADLASAEPPVVVREPTVTVLLYVASHQAKAHIRGLLGRYQPTWNLVIIQELPDSLRVSDPHLRRICDDFFDPVMEDEHKGAAPHGYKDASLPVVLFHNTPNNSISPLWSDTENVPGSKDRRALFPRYERHHADRP